MLNLSPVVEGTSIGPIYDYKKGKGRDQYVPELGETCALTYRVFEDKTSQQKLKFDDYL